MNKETSVRLSKYRRIIQKLKIMGMEKVFSNNLGDAIGVAPALVRKDLSSLKIPGHKRGGYNIDELISEMDTILGKNRQMDVIVVGCGKLGSAIMGHRGIYDEGIKIVAGFDNRPDHVAYKGNIPIYHINKMEDFIRDNNIKIAVMAVPKFVAADIFRIMLDCGIQGLLNFSPAELKDINGKCLVNNVNIAIMLENLFFYLKNQQELDSSARLIEENNMLM
ncbi:MAG: redox-sensing transcriptional repressor Rex [Spirochaetia bacterium]|nr:redox-sensing transcriptional repressor Rex [Spirochaetia bacterium]